MKSPFKTCEVKEALMKSQKNYKERHYQHRVEKTFKVGGWVWLNMNMERLHGHANKINYLRYVLFELLQKVKDNAYIFILPPYILIWPVVKVENLNLYEPSMLDQKIR